MERSLLIMKKPLFPALFLFLFLMSAVPFYLNYLKYQQMKILSLCTLLMLLAVGACKKEGNTSAGKQLQFSSASDALSEGRYYTACLK